MSPRRCCIEGCKSVAGHPHKIEGEIGSTEGTASSEITGSGTATGTNIVPDEVVDSVPTVNAPVVDPKVALPLMATVEAIVKEEYIVNKIAVVAMKTDMKSPMKRSASADTGKIRPDGSDEPSAKLARKSLDSAFSKAKAADATLKKAEAAIAEETIPQTVVSADPVTLFVPGSQIEAQDFHETWHKANVMEVDMDEGEVLIQFEINNAKPMIEEWISMKSSRLRQVQSQGATPANTTPKRPVPTFTQKWTDIFNLAVLQLNRLSGLIIRLNSITQNQTE